ncbi:MAG: methionyl-tRNA formyltransferase [candidate division WOR-3 bacterium]
MRIVFFGTGEFAVPALTLLHDSGYEIVCAVTVKPRPSGRGRRLSPSPVAAAASRMGIRVIAPADPHADEVVTEITAMKPDAGVLAAYGVVLKPVLLDLPRFGIVNIHPSLLPAYRGAAPIQRQLMNGESRGGVTLILLSAEVDAGDIIARTEVDISSDETAEELAQRLAIVGAGLLPQVLKSLETGNTKRCPQDESKATRAPRITRADRIIDWSQLALDVHNRIRALSPRPGAVTTFRGRRLVVVRSRLLSFAADSVPGTIERCRGTLTVACGDRFIELVTVKPEGGRAQSGNEFCNGRRPRPGERFGES